MLAVPTAEAIDAKVGQNVRSLRLHQRLTLEALGHTVGVTYQQIQKYESGKNRISCSMMYRISTALECSIDDLFRGLPRNEIPLSEPSTLSRGRDDRRTAQAITDLPDSDVRRCFRMLVEALAAEQT